MISLLPSIQGFGALTVITTTRGTSATAEEIEALEAEHAAIGATDQRAEALKWRRAYENAKAEQSAAMDRAAQATESRDWYARQLKRCGKAVGQDDPEKIAAAVEAFVRPHKAAKA